jgi:hypothetical protein
MIDANLAVLDKLEDLIKCDGRLTITLNKTDLMVLHSAIHSEKVYIDKLFKGFAEGDNDGADLDSFCQLLGEIRADSVSDMETIIQTIVNRILET